MNIEFFSFQFAVIHAYEQSNIAVFGKILQALMGLSNEENQ